MTPGASVLAGEVIGHGNGSLLLQLCSAPDLTAIVHNAFLGRCMAGVVSFTGFAVGV